VGVADWSFPSNHARVLLYIAHDPGVRLRDIAARASVTERTAYGIVTDLTEAGYVVKRLSSSASGSVRPRRFGG
jgi:DNA-binding MarR family transcriptional regulator